MANDKLTCHISFAVLSFKTAVSFPILTECLFLFKEIKCLLRFGLIHVKVAEIEIIGNDWRTVD